MEKAAVRANSVMAFVEGGVVLGRVRVRVGGVLEEGGRSVRMLSGEEMGMWGMSAGEAFVDGASYTPSHFRAGADRV